MGLFSINVGKGFVELQVLAQNRVMWQKAVREGSISFMDNWINSETKTSFERFLPGFLERYEYENGSLGVISDDIIEEAYRKEKGGVFWRIEEAEESITFRKGVFSATHSSHKRNNKKNKAIVEEQSRVSRLLELMR